MHEFVVCGRLVALLIALLIVCHRWSGRIRVARDRELDITLTYILAIVCHRLLKLFARVELARKCAKKFPISIIQGCNFCAQRLEKRDHLLHCCVYRGASCTKNVATSCIRSLELFFAAWIYLNASWTIWRLAACVANLQYNNMNNNSSKNKNKIDH